MYHTVLLRVNPHAKTSSLVGIQAQFSNTFNSQVHNFQKLKNISLKAVNFLTTKSKVTCLSETVFFHSHIPELLQFSRPCG